MPITHKSVEQLPQATAKSKQRWQTRLRWLNVWYCIFVWLFFPLIKVQTTSAWPFMSDSLSSALVGDKEGCTPMLSVSTCSQSPFDCWNPREFVVDVWLYVIPAVVTLLRYSTEGGWAFLFQLVGTFVLVPQSSCCFPFVHSVRLPSTYQKAPR